MRSVPLLLVLSLAIACGQNSGGGGSSVSAQRGQCSFSGASVACEAIEGSDGQGVDILDVMIDVPVKIENSEIIFLADKSAVSSGRRMNCKIDVKNGETYRFALRGDRLLLMTAGGSFEMTKLSGGEGLGGSWTWRGYVDRGMHLLRNFTFLGSGRIIMRSNCELT